MRPKTAVFFVLFAVLLWLSAPTPTAAKETRPTNPDKGDIVLAGVVLVPGEGSNTGVPGLQALQGALVVIEGTKHATTTDSRGLFIFTEAPEGEVTVLITCEGYQPVKKRAKVVKGADTPETLRVEMLPLGASVTKGVLSGPGTLYATFVPRQSEERGGSDLTNFLAVLALEVDPVGEPREILTQDPNAPGWNPITDLSHFLMLWPPEAPSRTSYHKLQAVPIWPCFNKRGDVLYVSTTARRIEILNATRGNELMGSVPVGKNQAITDMALSPDGRFLWACLMGRSPTLLAVDTTTHQPVASLPLDAEMMIPTSLEPAGDKIYLTLVSGLDRNKAGKVIAVDPFTGATLAEAPVGKVPTDVRLSPDGKALYVANCGSGTVSVHHPGTLAELTSWTSGVAPAKLAITPDSQKVMVTNRGSGTVTMWDHRSRAAYVLIRVGDRPVDIATSLDGRRAYVSNGGDGTISTIDVDTGLVTGTTSPNPRANPLGLAVRPQPASGLD